AEHGPRQAAAAMGLVHEDVADPGEGGPVRDDAHVAGLRPVPVSADHQRGLARRLLHPLARDAGAPVGGRQPPVHALEIEPGPVVIDFVPAENAFHGGYSGVQAFGIEPGRSQYRLPDFVARAAESWRIWAPAPVSRRTIFLRCVCPIISWVSR